MSRNNPSSRTWRFPRLLVEDQLAFAALVWAGFVVVTAGITLGIALFGTVTGSVWAPAASSAPWFTAFIAGWALHTAMPMYVANGRTRRDTAIEVGVFGAIYAPFAALLVTLGFVLERGLYAIGGWPRDIPNDHLYSSHGELHLIFIEYLGKILVWVSAGALVGAAIYRYESNGYLALAPAAALIGLNGGFTAGAMGFLERLIPAFETTSAPLAIAISLACTVAALAMTWPIVRDLPLRNK